MVNSGILLQGIISATGHEGADEVAHAVDRKNCSLAKGRNVEGAGQMGRMVFEGVKLGRKG